MTWRFRPRVGPWLWTSTRKSAKNTSALLTGLMLGIAFYGIVPAWFTIPFTIVAIPTVLGVAWFIWELKKELRKVTRRWP